MPEPRTASSPVLRAERAEVTYPNGVQALGPIDLEIEAGSFVSLLGPSGCGKSTLLRLFAGLQRPSAGHALRWGSDPRAAAVPGGQRFSMVFQDPTLMPWRTVAGNVRLPQELKGVAREQAEPRVRRALEAVGLSSFATAYPRELSGGMRMRASIARALSTEPDLLLMDEPFAALDEFNRNRLDADLRALWSQRGFTVVFVTHSIFEAVYLSNRVVVMGARPGRVLADLPIEGPSQRDDAFRVSDSFIRTCQQLSDWIARANQATP